MLKIDINLATKRYHKSIIPDMAAVGALFLAFVFTWYNADLYRLNLSQKARLSQQITRLEKAPGPEVEPVPAMTGNGLKLLIDEVEYINSVIERETFSWTVLLTGLEASVPPNISIVQISPEFKNKTVMVSGMARSMNDVLKFVDELGRSKHFMDVFLLRHKETIVKKGTPGKRFVSFGISAKYVSGVAL
jgi:type IV pilus assembly protein PilN